MYTPLLLWLVTCLLAFTSLASRIALEIVRDEDGRLLLVESANSTADISLVERDDAGHQLSKRSPLSHQLCYQYNRVSPPCVYEWERCYCTGETTFQVTCTGCYEKTQRGRTVHYGTRDQHQTPRGTCPPQKKCIIFPNTRNPWDELSDDFACINAKDVVTWTAMKPEGLAKDATSCSKGLTNSIGRDVNVEAVVNIAEEHDQYPVSAKQIYFENQGFPFASDSYVSEFAYRFRLKARMTIQACIVLSKNAAQHVHGRFIITAV